MTPTAPSRRVTVLWAALGLAAAAWYFGWLLQPGRPGVAYLFAALVVADLFNGLHAVSFWLTCLRDRVRDPGFRLRPDARPRVDVLIPTLDEPLDVLERTLRGVRRMHGADVRIWLLDDGARRPVADLALLEGAEYVARGSSEGAKAGNLNHALRIVAADGAELVAVFDADHVPRRHFLQRTLPHLGDPDVALVQTPQVYANTAAGPLTRAAAEQQAIFFGPICRGREAWGGAFCCGTNFVARLDDLLAVGGFPEDSVTEDIVLSIRLVGRGRRIAYEPEPLADGLGPEDARSYLKQQFRWAAGCLDLLLRRPGTLGPLSWTQRWQYVTATSYWLTGWTILVYVTLPVAHLAFDAPVLAPGSGEQFAVHYLPYFLLAVVSLGRFSQGAYTARGLVLNWGCFFVHVRATVAVLRGRPGGFAVTSKRALTGVPWRLLAPNLVVVAILLGAAGVALAGGITPSVLANVSFALLAAALVGPIVGFAIVQARRAAAASEPPPEPRPATRRFERRPEPVLERV